MAVGTTTAVLGGLGLGAAGSLIGAKQTANAAKDAAATQATSGANALEEQKRQYDLTRGDTLNMYNQQRADYAPFLQAGTAGVKELQYLLGLGGNEPTASAFGEGGRPEGAGEYGSLMRTFSKDDFEADPGYQFRLAEGQKALERANAARGKYFSGQAIKGLSKYNQDMASQEYQSAFDRYNTNQTNLYNRLAGVAGTGQTAAAGNASAGANANSTLSANNANYGNNASNLITGIGASNAAGQMGAANAWSSGLQNIGNNAMFAGLYGADKGWFK